MATQSRPIIGIATDYLPETKFAPAQIRLDAGYVDAILAAGGLPMLLPSFVPIDKQGINEINAWLDIVDGVIISGGKDLDPKRQGLPTHPRVEKMDARREEHDRRLFTEVQKRRMPLLGIGVGMQLINVALGGTLYLHLPEEMPKAMPHRDEPGEPHRHLVLIETNTFMYEIYGDCELRVNSDHHQAVQDVGEGLQVGAKSPDGVIEGIEYIDRSWFCIGVQWHPEGETATALDMQLFDAFLQACEGQNQTLKIAA